MFKRPPQLKKGARIAIISQSWGGPAAFPHIYEAGLDSLRSLGFEISEYPTARMSAAELHANPQARAEDVNRAFEDSSIQGIISSIGGEDSVRILPYLDTYTIASNPKFIMGFSDYSTLSTYLNQCGLVTFNGPSVMAGFSQLAVLGPDYRRYLEDFLFAPEPALELPAFESYSNGYPDWADKENTGKILPTATADGWRWIQGQSRTQGYLYGGCLTVLEMMKSSEFWPEASFWNDRILFLETSEDKPPPDRVKYCLRNYGVMGAFEGLQGLLIGRSRDYSAQEKSRLEEIALQIVRDEFGRPDLPIICNMDFGHTDPQMILPLGGRAEIDPGKQRIRLLESPFE